MATKAEYDVIVIGAGPVGQTLAERTRAAGLSVAVVERELVGGECSYWACIPSKAMLRPVTALADAQAVDGARQAISSGLDPVGVFRRRDRSVSDWDDSGQAAWIKEIGAELVRGHGRLDGVRRVVVATSDDRLIVLTARHAVAVCTGSRPALPDLPGIAEAHAWTNRQATDASYVPGRLAVVGGGGVGVEMATAWHALGAEVTIIARENRLLERMEPFASDLVADGLRAAGAVVRTGVSVTEFQRPHPTGPVRLVLSDDTELEADEVLLATGRAPITGDIGLETIGLTPGSWLDVDTTCRVRGIDDGWLYALGDVNHHALLTHQGKYQARAAGHAIGAQARGQVLDTAPWGADVITADAGGVPQVYFTNPEAASVGLTAEQARHAGHRTRIVDVGFDRVPASLLHADDYRGQARMVVDEDRGHLLGVTMVGPGVGEMLHAATIAVTAEVPIARLWHAVPCFPTLSEIWLRLLEAYRG